MANEEELLKQIHDAEEEEKKANDEMKKLKKKMDDAKKKKAKAKHELVEIGRRMEREGGGALY